jgi:Mn2+/Fe2+ NRAMP family transporter
MDKLKLAVKKLGPGLLFASSAIGTSHLVLSTRAGAHHGMIYFWIIALCLLLKYPFYEFGARYAATTNKNLLDAYREQGLWAIIIMATIIIVNMFTVTAAVAAVTAGLLSVSLSLPSSSMPLMVFIVLFLTCGFLILGGFNALNKLVKIISLILLIAIGICFSVLLFEGPQHPPIPLKLPELFEGTALILFISLVGWMPSGMSGSVLHSIWVVKNRESNSYEISPSEVMTDFKTGYLFTSLTAFMFLLIGAYVVYGSGQKLEGNAVQFTAALINIFTSTLGPWSKWIISIAALGTIYGTLIVVIDAFSRAFLECRILILNLNTRPTERHQNIMILLVCTGAFLIFMCLSDGMIHMLEAATIISFLCSPVLAFLNLRAVQKIAKEGLTILPLYLTGLAYAGLALLVCFALYYVWHIPSL